MASAWHDVLFTTRLLRRAPVFTAAAVLTLALGVGVNTTVFSVVNAIILRPLPVRDADRLVVIASRHAPNRSLGGISFPDLQDYRAATSEVFEDIAGYTVGFLGLTREGGRPERVLVTWTTGNYFQLLGIRPALGRFIQDADIRHEARPIDSVVVLGYSTWQRRFGGDPSVIGRVVTVNGRACTIVGVGPPGFFGTFAFSESEVYLPDSWSGASDADWRRARGLHTLARLRPGTTIERAQAAMDVVADRLAHLYPESNENVAVSVLPERLARPQEDQVRSNARVAAIMLALVGLVVLVAAVNVTNLLLARATGRRKELAIRAAIGAGRLRLIRQMVTESLMIAALGGTVGVVLGAWAGAALATIRLPGNLPVRLDFRLDWRVLMYSVCVVLMTGGVVGLVPALRASRVDLDRTLRQSAHGSPSGARRHRIRSGLVVTQIAACFVLLVAAGLFVRSLQQAERADLGFRPDGVLNVHMDVGQLGYTKSQGEAFFDDVERRVREIPGVQDLSFAFTIPMGYVNVGEQIEVDGSALAAGQRLHAGKNIVSPGYFQTMDVRIVRGRSFGAMDTERARPVAIVNEHLADLLWPAQDPLGRRFRGVGHGEHWIEVVGVTRTGKYRFLFEDAQPFFYVPMAQSYTELRVLQVRASVTPETLAPAVERLIQAREPNLTLYDVQSMTRALGGGYGFFLVRVGAVSAGASGLLGLLLAVVGVYGVVSYTMSQRTHEIGVRIALGATRLDIVGLALQDALMLLLSGLATGLLAALACSRVVGTLLFGVSSRDPATFAYVTPILGGVVLIACAIPAWRAARVDPAVTLRSE